MKIDNIYASVDLNRVRAVFTDGDFYDAKRSMAFQYALRALDHAMSGKIKRFEECLRIANDFIPEKTEL